MEDQDTQIPLSKKKSLAKKLFFFVFAVLFFAVAGVAAYSSYELYKIKSQNYQQQAIEKQAKDIIGAVGKLIELPSDTPKIATVTDAEALKKNQPFFDNSQNGDKILIFQKEVILYRPSADKIINVGPVINSPPQTATQPPSPAESVNPIDVKNEPEKK